MSLGVVEPQLYPFQWRDGRRIWLLDTPGFDDTRRSDADILKEVIPLLVQLKQRVEFAGIIYLYPITNNRMQGTARKNLSLMRAICGEAAYKHVVLTLTMWEEFSDDILVAFRRENHLLQTDDWWGSMRSQGSVAKRHNGTLDSARDIINQVVVQRSNHGPFMLRIHKEMIDEEKTLEETTVGKEVYREYNELMVRLEQQRRELNEEYRRALRERDDHHAVEMAKQQTDLTEQLRKAEQAQQGLRTEYEDMVRATRAKHEQLVQQLQQQVHEATFGVQNLEEQLRIANLAREQDRRTYEREKAIFMERISTLEAQHRYQEAEREKAKREKAEWERAERERAERERAERERAERERAERERAEWERAKREKAEREKAELVRYKSNRCPVTVNTKLQPEKSYLDAVQDRRQLYASYRGHISIIVFFGVIG